MLSFTQQPRVSPLFVFAVLAVSLVFGQSKPIQPQTTVIPPGFLKGSEHPELIPDNAAIKAFLLAIAEPSDAGPKELARLAAKLQAVGLTEADREALVPHVLGFADAWRSYAETARQLNAKIGAGSDPRAINDRTALVGTMDLLASVTFASMTSRLSPPGATRLREHIQAIKKKMYIVPPPDMSKPVKAQHH
jgi:hypothetical protein